MITVDAAEQVFARDDGGCSSLLWIDHPTRPLLFLLHDFQFWRGWPDAWDGQAVEVAGAVRGFGYLVQRAGLEAIVGQAVRPEQAYRADVEELEDGWRLTDGWGRLLRLESRPEVRWWVEGWG